MIIIENGTNDKLTSTSFSCLARLSVSGILSAVSRAETISSRFQGFIHILPINILLEPENSNKRTTPFFFASS